MSGSRFHVELLSSAHERASFNSGSAPLDRYLHEQVSQDVRRRVTACFVALDGEGAIAGYYTLAASSIRLADLPQAIGKKLPRYPSVPVVRMGRLAVDQRFKGLGLGGALLADALARSCRSDIAAYALVVDAKDAQAADFYRHHGFVAFDAMPLTLFLPLATAKSLIGI